MTRNGLRDQENGYEVTKQSISGWETRLKKVHSHFVESSSTRQHVRYLDPICMGMECVGTAQ